MLVIFLHSRTLLVNIPVLILSKDSTYVGVKALLTDSLTP